MPIRFDGPTRTAPGPTYYWRDDMKEVWKSIPGYEGAYEVSSRGRVRSFARYPAGRIMRQATQKSGHKHVTLYQRGKKRNALVHCLVLRTFVGPAPRGQECRHLNGKAGANRLTNLKWGTRSRNQLDRKHTGRLGSSRLRPAQVRRIKKKLVRSYWGVIADLARAYAVTAPTISAIKRGLAHRDVL